MTRHILSKTLLAAGAMTVLAAAPAAYAASAVSTKAPAKAAKSTATIKVANNSRIGLTSRSLNNSRNFSTNRSILSLSTNNRSFNNNRSSFLTSFSSSNRGFSNSYRSGIGISFSIGSSSYSPYRWAPTNYGLYSPSYGSYSSYQARTSCDRVTLQGYRYGSRALVSVTECYNPWNGRYIVQGSERLIRLL